MKERISNHDSNKVEDSSYSVALTDADGRQRNFHETWGGPDSTGCSLIMAGSLGCRIERALNQTEDRQNFAICIIYRVG